MTGVVTGCNVPLLHGDNSPSKLTLPGSQLGNLEVCTLFSHQKHNVLCTFVLIFRILNVLGVFGVIGVGSTWWFGVSTEISGTQMLPAKCSTWVCGVGHFWSVCATNQPREKGKSLHCLSLCVLVG